MKIKQKHLALVAMVAVVAITAVALYYIGTYVTGWFVSGEEGSEGEYDSFAKCLTENDAVMYGREGCGWCTKQKELFGDSFKHITYVECTAKPQLCQQKGISGVPSWGINDGLSAGLKTLEQLSTLTGCALA